MKKASTKPRIPKSTLGERKVTSFDEVEEWPGNARIHDMDKLTTSIEKHGQYRAPIVQKSTGYVVAGNGTIEAMKLLGYTGCEMDWQDLTDAKAEEINLMDNASNDEADYNWDALTDQLERVKDLAAAGYTKGDLDGLIELRAQNLQALMGEDLTEEAAAAPAAGDEDSPSPDEEGDDEDPPDDLTEYDSDIGTVTKLDTEVWFHPTADTNPYDIPELRLDMCADVPDDVNIWAGPIISEKWDKAGSHFLYQYSTDSTRDMPWDRTTLGFYVHDQRFENWWGDPAKYVGKMINVGVHSILTPDYSTFVDMPEVLRIMNCYRSYWIGRFAQEAGIKVIPNLVCGKEEDSAWSHAGAPVGCPVVAIQVQTIERRDRKAELKEKRLIRDALDVVQPGKLIVYAGPRGRETVEAMKLDLPVIYVPNRAEVKDEWREVRDGGMKGDTRKSAK